MAAAPGPPGSVPDAIDEHYYRSPGDHGGRRRITTTQHERGPGRRSSSASGPLAPEAGTVRRSSRHLICEYALADAAWMTGMERNSDVVLISCYAPLFVNVNKGGMQWPSDLIGYDALNSFGSPSYYAQTDVQHTICLGGAVHSVTGENIPTRACASLPRRKPRPGQPAAGASRRPGRLPTLFYRGHQEHNNRNRAIRLKVVSDGAGTAPAAAILT